MRKTHSDQAKSLIIRRAKQCYLTVVHMDGPAPHGVSSPDYESRLPMIVLSLRSLIKAAAAPVLLTAMLGLVIGFATVGVVGVA